MTSTDPDAQPALAAAATLKYIEDQLTEERATKTALEGRANTVITSSGTLTTLLFALSALGTKKASTYQLPNAAQYLLVLAVVCFLAAIAFALLVAAPAAYAEVTTESLEAIATPEAFGASEAEARPKIAAAMVAVIKGARAGNKKKAEHLRNAVVAELGAAVALAIAMVVVLID